MTNEKKNDISQKLSQTLYKNLIRIFKMKKIVLLGLVFTTFNAYSNQDIKPLEMDLGYWEITTTLKETDMIRDMLASLPESQRAQVRATMKIPVVKQCVTEDSVKDMGRQLKNSFSHNEAPQNCEFDVTKSTSTEFIGALNCSLGNTVKVHTKVINSKRHESSAVSHMGDMKSEVFMVGEWKLATCPSNLK